MLPQVQRAVVDVILEKYTGPEKEICEVLLESLVHTILMIMDEGFITTHSFPSGHYLTAIMNSLVNRFYTACWYFRVMSHAKRSFTVSSFLDDVVDFVYGDDKLNGIRSHSDILNAISMREFFRSIGLDLTNADKSEIKTPFNVLDDLDFLKRKFVYHNDLGRIMCPLSLRTLQSGLSYVNLSKDVDQVMRDKVHNYVREIYLHPNYKDLRLDFEHRLAFRGFDCELPSDAYLYQLYASGDLSYDMLYM
jgi:RNA dependent RNA polymerase